MSETPPQKRPYKSRRRQEQARRTRRQIIDAAHKLFLERGYSGASLSAIAQEADVAVETIYAAFGNKRALLARLIDVSLVGDDQPAPLLQRSGPQAVMHSVDQRQQIALFANDMYEIMQRMAPLFDVMRTAAKIEPEIADMLYSMLAGRVQGMRVFVDALATNGPLREGVTPEGAAETVWAITSGEVFSLLVGDRGWSDEHYKGWLTDTLIRLLLP